MSDERKIPTLNDIKRRVNNMDSDLLERMGQDLSQHQNVLYISIAPESDNLKRAYKTLARVFHHYALPFAFKHITKDNLPTWDTVVPSERYLTEYYTDRDERGREVTVYLPKDDNRDEAAWKQILLHCWKELHEEEVNIGYCLAANGDTPIKCERVMAIGEQNNGVPLTPFSLGELRPSHQRHGDLSKAFNVMRATINHPLAQVCLTSQDLSGSQLQDAASEVQRSRFAYHKVKAAHAHDCEAMINEAMKCEPDEYADAVAKSGQIFTKAYTLPEKGLRETLANEISKLISQQKQQLCKQVPYLANYDKDIPQSGIHLIQTPLLQKLFDSLAVFVRSIRKTHHNATDDFQRARNEAVNNFGALSQFVGSELRRIQNDYLNNPLMKQWLTDHEITSEYLRLKIMNDPKEMQCLYRKLKHCLDQQVKSETILDIYESYYKGLVKKLTGVANQFRTPQPDKQTQIAYLKRIEQGEGDARDLLAPVAEFDLSEYTGILANQINDKLKDASHDEWELLCKLLERTNTLVQNFHGCDIAGKQRLFNDYRAVLDEVNDHSKAWWIDIKKTVYSILAITAMVGIGCLIAAGIATGGAFVLPPLVTYLGVGLTGSAAAGGIFSTVMHYRRDVVASSADNLVDKLQDFAHENEQKGFTTT